MSRSSASVSDRASGRWKVVLFIGLLVVCLLLSLVTPIRQVLSPDHLHLWISRLGAMAYVGYVAALVLGEILFVPRMALITAGGLLFVPLWAGLLSVAADLIAGSVFYVVASRLARPWVQTLIDRSPRLSSGLDMLGRRHGVWAVALLRVCPVAHYTTFSYGCGLWGVPYGRYLVGTFIGVLPGAMLYPFFGSAITRPGSPVFWLALVSLVVFLVGTYWLGKKMVAVSAGERAMTGLEM
ncbi:MAG: TVP38/TMEM64 family protein [Deltaproteobacteria bacterium]|nr:TVP38/TMEM64 family protein [Deltaproteobacteria bacterium]